MPHSIINALSEEFIDSLRVGFATSWFHHLADEPLDPLQIGFDIGNLVLTLGNDFDPQALQRDLGLAA